MDNQNSEQASNQPSDSSSPPNPPDTFSPTQPNLTNQPTGPNIPQVISNNEKPRRRWRKPLMIFILVVLLAAAGYAAYKKFYADDDANKATQVTQSKEIPLLKIGIQSADYGKLYPEMSTNEYSFLVNTQIFEGLVRYENKNKIVPDLATDWTNPDSKTWLFTIKQGVKFHDGREMTADDVKYSLDKAVAGKSDFSGTFASTIASVAKVGNDQIKLTTTDPDPTLLNKLAFLYIIDADLPKGAEPSQAGTGPYQVKQGTTPSSKKFELTAFDGYHGGRPTTRALAFGTEDTDEGLIKAFENGDYDIIGSVAPDRAEQVKGATKFVSTEPDVHFLGFNLNKTGPLQKMQVREAIRYSVDPLAIGKARGNEVTALSQLIPPSIPGYNPVITPYKRDIAKVKQLLKEAGYPNGVSIKFSTSDTPEATAEIIKELKEAGITLKPDQHNDFDEFINFFIGGKAEMYTVDYSSDTLDGLDILTTTISDSNYTNKDLAALIDQAGSTVDPAARLKLLQDAELIIDKDIPVVPLSTEDNLWLMNNDYDIVQDMPSSYISVYFYKAQLK